MCAMSRWKGSRLVRFENRPETSSRRIKSILEKKIGGMGYLSSPLEPLEIAKNSVFWAKSRGSKGGKGASHHPKKISGILLALLEDIFGRFSNLTNLEPFHLDQGYGEKGYSIVLQIMSCVLLGLSVHSALFLVVCKQHRARKYCAVKRWKSGRESVACKQATV